MKRVTGILLFVAIVATATFGQQPVPDLRQIRVFQGPEGAPPPPPPGADFVFVATESFDGKVIKGAPYSGEAVTETIQTLADGNRIVNKITSQVYRDSEGRTRREQTLKGLGPVGTSEEPLQTIFINDPIAGVTYALDSRTLTAHKSVPFRFELKTKAGVTGPDGLQHFEFKTAPPSSGSANVIVAAPTGPGPQVRLTGTAAAVQAEVGATYTFKTRPGNANEVKQDLGKQFMEGVEAEGTRTTVTIPAGEIGNERPIEIVSERWYSPELQLIVMTRHSDPRFGETTYKLTNINRADPAKSLFEVPAGYTVKEGIQGEPLGPFPRKRSKPE